MIDEMLWRRTCALLQGRRDVPQWVEVLLHLTAAEVSKFPEFEQRRIGESIKPSLHLATLQQDYLDFLKRMIEVDAKGPEWLAVLKRRLRNLQPFCGRLVIVANFFRKLKEPPHYVTSYYCKLDAETGVFIHGEEN